MNSVSETLYKMFTCVYVLLQVFILNGTDLKTMINYTGEQVNQRFHVAALSHARLALVFPMRTLN